MRIRSLRAILPAVLFAVAPVVSAGAWTGFPEWLPVSASDWQLPAAESSLVAHAIVLFDGAIIDDSGSAGVSYSSRYRRLLVLDQQGLDAGIEVEIPFSKGERLVRLEARTFKRGQGGIDVEDEAIHEKTLLSGRGIRLRAKSFAFSGAAPGDLLEYRYTMRSDGFEPPDVTIQGPLYVRDFAFTWYFQPRLALSEDLVEQYPAAVWTPAWTLVNARMLPSSVEELPDPSNPDRIEINIQDVPALPKEPFMPPDETVAARILCHYKLPRLDLDKNYWERMSSDAVKELGGFLRKPSRVDKWMEDLQHQDRDFDDDVARCFALIHRDIGNVDFLGPGAPPGDVPDNKNVNEIVERRFGDSADMTMLLTAMLRRLGYRASLFFVRDRSVGTLVRQWESFRQFTLSGVVVSDKGTCRWLFPNYPAATPASVPWQAQNCDALVIDPSQEESSSVPLAFLSVPIAPPGLDRILLDVALRLAGGRNLCGRLRARWLCPSDLTHQQELRDMKSKEALRKLKDGLFPEKVDWTAFDESYAVDSCRVSYACSLVVRNLVEEAGVRRFVDLGPLRLDDFMFPDGPRQHGIDIAFPVRYQSRVELEIPAGCKLEALPSRSSLGEESWRFASEAVQNETTLVLSRDLSLTKALLGPTAAWKLRSFFTQAYAQDRHTAVLVLEDAAK